MFHIFFFSYNQFVYINCFNLLSRLKGNLEHEYQQIKVENARLKQMIQEISNRGGSEVDQWRKLVEQEKFRADKAEADIKQFQQQLQQQLQVMHFKNIIIIEIMK